jgi:hypothetical protein
VVLPAARIIRCGAARGQSRVPTPSGCSATISFVTRGIHERYSDCARASDASRKQSDAEWVDRAFAAGWKNADSMLSIEGL